LNFVVDGSYHTAIKCAASVVGNGTLHLIHSSLYFIFALACEATGINGLDLLFDFDTGKFGCAYYCYDFVGHNSDLQQRNIHSKLRSSGTS
jgi:hypothetical protein